MKGTRLATTILSRVGRQDVTGTIKAADDARDNGRLAEAADLYAKVPATSRRKRGALIQRGNMLKDLARFDEARAAYEAAWRMRPDDPDLAIQLGHLAKRSGRLDDALNWYRKAGGGAIGEVGRLERVGGDPRAVFNSQLAIDPASSAQTLATAVDRVVGSGFLDVEYYRSRYSSAKTDEEIYDELLRCGAFNGRSYSAKLDTIGYILSNRDLSDEGFDYTSHYRDFGEVEKRGVSPRYRKFTTVANAFPAGVAALPRTAPVERIAIHLHLFYPDYAGRFRRYLSRFPKPFELLISCGDRVTDTDLALFESLPNLTRMIVKRSTNRGRNFAPMLVDFRKELRDVDIACHLHSKKSLFSGREQVGWASYQIEHLVGDPHLVRDHIAVFESDPAMAVIAPVPYWNSPYFASHWLQNEHAGRALLARLGIDGSEGFLSYPVGGMFWFRPERLKRLLDVEWTYQDFPEEAGQTDGTLQHALERSVAIIAAHDGGHTAYYESWTHRYGLDAYDVLAEYRRHGASVILAAAEHAKIVSFDVFDTVFYRESLDKEVGKRAVARWLGDAGEADLAGSFIAERNNAEMELRREQSFVGDVSIVEVYRRLADLQKLGGADPAKLARLEFEADLRDQKPRTSIVDLVNALADRGKRVIFVSDTYYSRAQIVEMLLAAGVRRPDKVYVSSELRQRKDNTRIWPQLATMLNVAITDFLHVGDNVVADVQLVGDRMIPARLVLSLIDKASYLFGKNLNDPAELAALSEMGLRSAIIAAGKHPFFVH